MEEIIIMLIKHTSINGNYFYTNGLHGGVSFSHTIKAESKSALLIFFVVFLVGRKLIEIN